MPAERKREGGRVSSEQPAHLQLRSGTRDTDIFCCPCRADTDRAEAETKAEREGGRAEKVQIIKTAGKAQLVHSSHFATWERESRLNLSRESLDDKKRFKH